MPGIGRRSMAQVGVGVGHGGVVQSSEYFPVKVCAVDGQMGQCLGCGRTLKEIGGWMGLGDDGRREVMEELPARMEQLRASGKLGPAS